MSLLTPKERAIFREARKNARKDEPSFIQETLSSISDWYDSTTSATRFAQIRDQDQKERLAQAREPTSHINYSPETQQDIKSLEQQTKRPSLFSYVQKLSDSIEKAAINTARFVPDILSAARYPPSRLEGIDDVPVLREEKIYERFFETPSRLDDVSKENDDYARQTNKQLDDLLSKLTPEQQSFDLDEINSSVDDLARKPRDAQEEIIYKRLETSPDIAPYQGQRLEPLIDVAGNTSNPKDIAREADRLILEALAEPEEEQESLSPEELNQSIDDLARTPEPSREDFDPVAFDRQLRQEEDPLCAAQNYVSQLVARNESAGMLENRFMTYNKRALKGLSEEDQVRAAEFILEKHRHDYMGGMSPSKILAKADKELHERWRNSYHGTSTQTPAIDDFVQDPLVDDFAPASKASPSIGDLVNEKETSSSSRERGLFVPKIKRTPLAYINENLESLAKKFVIGAGVTTAGIAGAVFLVNALNQEPTYEQSQEPTTQIAIQGPNLDDVSTQYMSQSAVANTAVVDEPSKYDSSHITIDDITTLPVYDVQDATPGPMREFVFDERAPDSPVDVVPLPEPIDDIVTIPESPYAQPIVALFEDANRVTFNTGDSAWGLLSAQGCRGNNLIDAIKQAGIDNKWYSESRIQNDTISGNPLQFDTQPQKGGTYTLPTCAQKPAPNGLTPFTPENGVGVLAALAKTFGYQAQDLQKTQALILTGVYNDLYPSECLTSGDFNVDVCNPIHDIRPWRAGQEYMLVKPN